MATQAIGSTTGVSASLQLTAKPRTESAAKPVEPSHDVKHADETRTTQSDEARPQRDPRSLQYQVDIRTHRVVTTIVDDKSSTVIRQIPDAEVLRIAQAIDRMQGFLVEEKA